LSVPRHLALKELLLPGMAVYASPENLQVYKDITIPEDSIQYSSEIIRKVYTCVNLCQVLCVVSHNIIFSYYICISQVIPRLSRICFPIILSQNHSWTLEPWHIRASMRKQGLEFNNAITLPKQKIWGPDENLESKEFPVWLKVNTF
jgi:hypothetical protein